jgi:hypothetical protein
MHVQPPAGNASSELPHIESRTQALQEQLKASRRNEEALERSLSAAEQREAGSLLQVGLQRSCPTMKCFRRCHVWQVYWTNGPSGWWATVERRHAGGSTGGGG